MKTQEQIEAREHILHLIRDEDWEYDKEKLDEVQSWAKVLVPDLNEDKNKVKTKEQQELEEERYQRNKVILSLADEGYSYKRIAELMECSPSTVRKAINDWEYEKELKENG